MPQFISCPDCQRKLRVPDNLMGKKVRCPTCSVMFKAIAVGADDPAEDRIQEPDEVPASRRRAPATDERVSQRPRLGARSDDRDEEERPRRRRDEEDDEDRPRSRRDRDDEDDYDDRGPSRSDQKAGWNKVRIGINLVMIGTWVWLAGAALGGLGGILAIVILGGAITSGSLQSGMATGGIGIILLGLSAVLYRICQFVELVMRAVGFGLCLAVPPQRGTALKPLAITAFVLACVDILFNILNIIGGIGYTSMARFSSGSGSPVGSSGFGGFSLGLVFLLWVVGLASVVVFLFFLRSVANVIRARDLPGKCVTMAIVLIVYDVLKWLIIGVLIFATIGSAIFAVRSAMETKSTTSAANTMGAMAIICVVVICLLVLIYGAFQVWYVFVMQKVRDAVASHRRRM
jgi:hypothetical protein